jgi:hypothetical protein
MLANAGEFAYDQVIIMASVRHEDADAAHGPGRASLDRGSKIVAMERGTPAGGSRLGTGRHASLLTN